MIGSEKQIAYAKDLLEKEYSLIENYETNLVAKSVIDSYIYRNPVEEIDTIELTSFNDYVALEEKYGSNVFKKNTVKPEEVLNYLSRKSGNKRRIIELKKKAYKNYLDSFEKASDVIETFK